MYFVLRLQAGLRPPYKYMPISMVQNTQAPSEFLTTSTPQQKPWLLSIFQELKVTN